MNGLFSRSSFFFQTNEICLVRDVLRKIRKNGFAIFSGVVAVGSKGGLMVQGTMSSVAVAVWAIEASMWAVAVSMWAVMTFMLDVAAFVHATQVACGMPHPPRGLSQAPCGLLHHLRGLLQPLCMAHVRYVGCCRLYVGSCSLHVGCHKRRMGCLLENAAQLTCGNFPAFT